MNMCKNCKKTYENEENNITNCIPYEEYIKVDRLSRAYVPYQIICSYYEPLEALKNGTVFPSLYMPYKEV